MKSLKAIACVLSVTMLAGIFAGCSKTTKITTDKFIKACEKLKLECYDIDDDDSPDEDDIADGIYTYADSDYIEDEEERVEDFLQEIGLSEVIDVDDVESFALAIKCTGIDSIEDIEEPEDLEDLELDGAVAFQMTLSDAGYVEDFMDYLDDMLDLANISSKDLTNAEFYTSKKEGYLRFHVDVAKLAALVIDNDDIMDTVDLVADADDVEDALSALTGDVAVTVEINGNNIFVLIGGSVNTKPTVLNAFTSAFGAASNPIKVPMNEKVCEEAIENAFDTFSKQYLGAGFGYDDYDYDYDDWDDDYEDEED